MAHQITTTTDVIDSLEVKARTILNAARAINDMAEYYSPTQHAILGVFQVKHYSALSLEKIMKLALALDFFTSNLEDTFRRELKKLVRNGTLCSRVNGGVRYWEINY